MGIEKINRWVGVLGVNSFDWIYLMHDRHPSSAKTKWDECFFYLSKNVTNFSRKCLQKDNNGFEAHSTSIQAVTGG